MLRPCLILLASAAATLAQAAAPRLSEAQAREFLERQSRAWNAGDLGGYFGLFTPDATFVEQARSKDGRLVPYGTSTLPQARAQARRFFAEGPHSETDRVRGIRIAPDGRTALVITETDSRVASAGRRARRICAVSEQTLALTPAGLRSRGQTETVVACR